MVRLMPSELVTAIISAEEIARETNISLKNKFKKFKTHVIDWKDFIIDPDEGSYSFLERTGEGTIEELIIISPNDNFSLIVEVDGILTYQGSFSRFQEISIHIGSIVATQRGTKYILQVGDIKFLNHIGITIDVDAKTIFQRLYCKYILEDRES